jgi:hypothetical protein
MQRIAGLAGTGFVIGHASILAPSFRSSIELGSRGSESSQRAFAHRHKSQVARTRKGRMIARLAAHALAAR